MRPKCFESNAQWEEWKTWARASEHSPENFCGDCLPDHQYEMMRANRCAHPEVTFVIRGSGEDAGIAGVFAKPPTSCNTTH